MDIGGVPDSCDCDIEACSCAVEGLLGFSEVVHGTKVSVSFTVETEQQDFHHRDHTQGDNNYEALP
jgi:hypothetical protein